MAPVPESGAQPSSIYLAIPEYLSRGKEWPAFTLNGTFHYDNFFLSFSGLYLRSYKTSSYLNNFYQFAFLEHRYIVHILSSFSVYLFENFECSAHTFEQGLFILIYIFFRVAGTFVNGA